MFLVGNFERYPFFSDNPLNEVSVISKVEKSHLLKCRDSETYQVINVANQTYFNPQTNSWIKMKSS